MANQNQKNEMNKTDGQVQEQPQVQQVPQQPETNGAPQQTPAEEPKEGFGRWLKRHWKGVVGAVAGAAAVGGSAVVAYKKGKAAGIMACPAPQQEEEDYSLNPNV